MPAGLALLAERNLDAKAGLAGDVEAHALAVRVVPDLRRHAVAHLAIAAVEVAEGVALLLELQLQLAFRAHLVERRRGGIEHALQGLPPQALCARLDFGSAVRAGENIQGNPLLANLYDELMRTSQIQRMIEKMTISGAVTSHLIQSAYGRVDKQVDLFYLAMQMVQPLNNPDFRGLVEFDPTSREAAALSTLKEQVLKPADPKKPIYRNAPDVLRAILRIEQDLKGRPTRRTLQEPAGLVR